MSMLMTRMHGLASYIDRGAAGEKCLRKSSYFSAV
jgi:hypothetical protein